MTAHGEDREALDRLQQQHKASRTRARDVTDEMERVNDNLRALLESYRHAGEIIDQSRSKE